MTFSLCDCFFECDRFTPLVGGCVWVEAIEVCLEESHDSSGRGLRMDLDGWWAMPLIKPVEEDRVGIAFGDAGFSVNVAMWKVVGAEKEGACDNDGVLLCAMSYCQFSTHQLYDQPGYKAAVRTCTLVLVFDHFEKEVVAKVEVNDESQVIQDVA